MGNFGRRDTLEEQRKKVYEQQGIRELSQKEQEDYLDTFRVAPGAAAVMQQRVTKHAAISRMLQHEAELELDGRVKVREPISASAPATWSEAAAAVMNSVKRKHEDSALYKNVLHGLDMAAAFSQQERSQERLASLETLHEACEAYLESREPVFSEGKQRKYNIEQLMAKTAQEIVKIVNGPRPDDDADDIPEEILQESLRSEQQRRERLGDGKWEEDWVDEEQKVTEKKKADGLEGIPKELLREGRLAEAQRRREQEGMRLRYPQAAGAVQNFQTVGHQETGLGCWAVAFTNLMRYAGAHVTQKEVRDYRPLSSETGSTDYAELIGTLNRGGMSQIVDSVDLLAEKLPGMALQHRSVVPEEGCGAVLGDMIRQAILEKGVPVAMRQTLLHSGSQHFITVVGISEQDEISYFDSLDTNATLRRLNLRDFDRLGGARAYRNAISLDWLERDDEHRSRPEDLRDEPFESNEPWQQRRTMLHWTEQRGRIGVDSSSYGR